MRGLISRLESFDVDTAHEVKLDRAVADQMFNARICEIRVDLSQVE